MSARHGLLAGGNWIVDHVKEIDTWPAQDALANILAQTDGNGGSAYNVLKNLARLGAGFPLGGVGLVGDDPDGRAILADCVAHGIDISQLRVTPAAATSYTDVMTVRGSGRRTFFHQRGANALLGPEHFDFNATRAKIFHLGYLLLLDALDACGVDGLPRAAEVLRRARAAGLVTAVDCVSEASDRFGSIVSPVLPEVDILFANDIEAEKLTGIALRPQGNLTQLTVEEAARGLLQSGVRKWVIVHFPEGVCAAGRSGDILWQPSINISPSEIIGAAGAGDALVAGVLHGWHDDWSMANSLRLGVCVAAASLRDPTCSEGVGHLTACLALESRGFRELPLRE